ncbi:unnamed protein product, partial [Prorocentrum cordatum]
GGEDGGTAEDPADCDADSRPRLALRLQRRYRAQFETIVTTVFRSLDRPAYLTVGEVRNRKLMLNFFAHAHNVTETDNTVMTVISVQLDHNGTVECERSRERFQTGRLDIRCVDLGGWLPDPFFGKRVHAGSGSCVYNMLIWTKPEIFLSAVRASQHDVIMIDTDVVMYHDLFKLSRQIREQHNYKVIVASENHGYHNPNTGVVLASKSGTEVLEWWTDVNLDFVSSFAGDQSAFLDLAKTTSNFWVHVGMFNPSMVGQCGIPGAWATHYNCLGGQKMSVMIHQSDWSDEVAKQYKFGRHRNNSLRTNWSGPRTWNDDDDAIQTMTAAGDWLIEE